MKNLYLQFYISLFCLLFSINTSSQNEIQRVRLDFETPTGYTRHLMLGFTPDNAASDEFDYGYDGLNVDDLPDDLNWIIGEDRYVIQGVGEFDISKCYPLGMFLSNSGNIKITLNALENFESTIDVFVYDHLLGTFESINSSDYTRALLNGDYMNRFYITFTNDITQINIEDNTLSLTSYEFEQTLFKYANSTQELIIDTNNTYNIKEISIFNINAQKLHELNYLNSNSVAISMQNSNANSFIIRLVNENNNVFYKQLIIK